MRSLMLLSVYILGVRALIISPAYRIDVDRALALLQRGAWVLSACSIILAGACYFIPLREYDHLSYSAGTLSDEEVLSLEALGSGPLALHHTRGAGFVPDLARELIVLARSSKPAMSSSSASILVSTKGSSQHKVIHSGEQVFLEQGTADSGEAVYFFTDKRTPLWIRPLIASSEDVNVEIGVFSSAKDSEGFIEEVTDVIVPEVRSGKEGVAGSGAYAVSLEAAHFFGSDLLYKNYGGREYKDLVSKVKLEIPSENGTDVYFVSSGDYLQWTEGLWHSVSFDDIDSDAPLAFIKSANPKEIDIQVWDERGFYPQKVRLSVQTQSPAAKAELLAAHLKLKTSSQVACTLGRRRFFLKEGDWLLKVGRSWRNLRRSKDIEDYLCHKLKGELFVFDSLERQAGKTMVKGHLFDEMRTQMLPLSLSVETEQMPKENEKKTKAKSSYVKKKRTAHEK